MKFKLILTEYDLNSTNLLQFQNSKQSSKLSWPNITHISLNSTNALSLLGTISLNIWSVYLFH